MMAGGKPKSPMPAATPVSCRATICKSSKYPLELTTRHDPHNYCPDGDTLSHVLT
jgi:hypothetical protein